MSVLAAAAALQLPHITYLALWPLFFLLGGALVILAWSSLTRRPLDTVWVTSLTVLAAAGGITTSVLQVFDVADHGAHLTVARAVVEDGFSALVSTVVCTSVLVAALVADSWQQREGGRGPELHVLMLVSASGALIMGMANDLIVVFLGLETLSIALYVLAATNGRRVRSGEAALKYFVLGSLSSAVFLYGVALVYGATGSTNLTQIADYLARNVVLHDGLLLAGLALLLVGFGFKVAAVPFHLWTPDVYQGAPSPVTGFMAAVAKVGGFAALLRVFVSSFPVLRADWQPAVWVIAALTLGLGAIVALVQRDIKRMLAYSSINHAGFVLLGLQAATARGVEASLYYLFVYSFMVLGSFAVVTVVGGPGDGRHSLERYRGLLARQPVLASAFIVLLLAQAGIPFTTGLWAKLEVVDAAVQAHSDALAVVAMVSAVVAAFFYLRVVFLMVWSPASAAADGAEAVPAGPATLAAGEAGELAVADGGTAPAEPVPGGVALALGLCVTVTVLFGVWPAPLTDFAHHARLLVGG